MMDRIWRYFRLRNIVLAFIALVVSEALFYRFVAEPYILRQLRAEAPARYEALVEEIFVEYESVEPPENYSPVHGVPPGLVRSSLQPSDYEYWSCYWVIYCIRMNWIIGGHSRSDIELPGFP